ncbi:MAG: cupin-like domain-containing protein [Betaproteobacteria bacterium]
MSGTTPRLVDVDWTAFNPWKVMPVQHRIVDHRLLQIESLIELSSRLAKFGRIRTHSNDAYAGTAFNHAPMLYPNQRPAAETLANIASAKAWMSLLNVQTDDIYRGLVDEVLDDLKPGIDRFDPGMVYRGGWIFVTSPNTVTPFHMDKEHNFILQVKGHKRLYVWEPDDIEVLSEAARDLFHANHSRDLVVWREEARRRAHVFDLEPGMGAYMPSTAPHMVENGDGPSITVSFTYYTDATRRNSRLHALHQRMRGWGLEPAAVGAHPVVDKVVDKAWQGIELLRRASGRKDAGATLSDRLPYALANVG